MKMSHVCNARILSNFVVCACALLLALAPVAGAQEDQALPSGEEVLDRYIEATGGREAYENIKSRVSDMTLQMPAQGIEGKMMIYQAQPDKGYIVMDLGPQLGKAEQGMNGDLVWERSAMTGVRLIEGAEEETLRRGLELGAELNPQKYYDKIETVGSADVNGEQAWKVELTTPSGNKETRYYSKESGLLLKTESTNKTAMGEIQVVGTAGDYQQFGDIKIPQTMTQEMMGQKIVLKVNDVKHNVDIPAERFEVPAEVKALMEKQQPATAPATQPGS